jgi:hypothetical protein
VLYLAMLLLERDKSGLQNSQLLVAWATKFCTVASDILSTVIAVAVLCRQKCVSVHMHQA